jgi:predicted ATPase
MNIKELKIEGFKSIGSITLKNPNPFSVFVGPNASGKSNIFEALELLYFCNSMTGFDALNYFGTPNEILTQSIQDKQDASIFFNIDLGENLKPSMQLNFFNEKSIYRLLSASTYGKIFHDIKTKNPDINFSNLSFNYNMDDPSFLHFTNFTRLFVKNYDLNRRTLLDDSRLSLDAKNLEKVLKRILKDEKKKEELVEIFQLLIPGFKDIDIATEELSGSDNLLIYENNLKKPLTKRLISDGTYNIIAIVTALYQSDEPQFLCIEEPENGLNPKVVRELVEMIRLICKEKGHYIWINTHSQSLISVLTTDEIIIVDKKNGLTQVKQIQGVDLFGLRMDEALLTNAIGGGIPW